MNDLLILGGSDTLYQPDALDGFGGSAESGVTFIAETKPLVPPDPVTGAPASESVFRRAIFKAIHSGPLSFYVTPKLNGQPQIALKHYYSRPAPTSETRVDFFLPLARRYRSSMVGLRGTAIAFLFEFTDPGSSFHLEDVVVSYEPIHAARNRKVGE